MSADHVTRLIDVLTRVIVDGLFARLGRWLGLLGIGTAILLFTLLLSRPSEPLEFFLLLWAYSAALPLVLALVPLGRPPIPPDWSLSLRILVALNWLGGIYVSVFVFQCLLGLLSLLIGSLLQLALEKIPMWPGWLQGAYWAGYGLLMCVGALLGVRPGNTLTVLTSNQVRLGSSPPAFKDYINSLIWGLGIPLVAQPSTWLILGLLDAQGLNTAFSRVIITVIILALLSSTLPKGTRPAKPSVNATGQGGITAPLHQLELHVILTEARVEHPTESEPDCVSVIYRGHAKPYIIPTNSAALALAAYEWSEQYQDEQSALDFGQQLGRLLFPAVMLPEFSRLLAVHREKGQALRIHIEPYGVYASLPWECATLCLEPRNVESRDILHQRADLSMVRSFPSSEHLAPVVVSTGGGRSNAINFAFAAGAARPLVDTRAEMDELKQLCMSRATRHVSFFENVTESVLAELPSTEMFHFSGHGLAGIPGQHPSRSYLLLGKSGDTAAVIDAQLLTFYLRKAGVRIAFFNACNSASGRQATQWQNMAQTLIQGGLTHVIAMQYPIRDRSARVLSIAFYESLFRGLSIEDSLAAARRAVLTSTMDYAGAGAAVLYTNRY